MNNGEGIALARDFLVEQKSLEQKLIRHEQRSRVDGSRTLHFLGSGRGLAGGMSRTGAGVCYFQEPSWK